ncbi:hypothetical protein CSKR_106010 [Clonorchis sinensis]|uniref:Uncharacterized protein n=1 Tax=Clonorchis sinensis TaxID=79923 RepID=A0A3R7D3C1_CLOSI|nr:hypothetical protein CSKR_106010 [Clonorchis sinensis]
MPSAGSGAVVLTCSPCISADRSWQADTAKDMHCPINCVDENVHISDGTKTASLSPTKDDYWLLISQLVKHRKLYRITNALLIRLLKIFRQPTTDFDLLGVHQFNPNWTDFDKYTQLQIILVFAGDSSQSLVYDVLQLNVLHTGRLMFQLVVTAKMSREKQKSSFEATGTIKQGKGEQTLICISFTKLNIHLLLERVFLNFSGYSLTVTQMQANATKRLHQFRNRSHFSGDAKRIYEKTCYSHAPSVVSTVTPLAPWKLKVQIGTNHLVQRE